MMLRSRGGAPAAAAGGAGAGERAAALVLEPAGVDVEKESSLRSVSVKFGGRVGGGGGRWLESGGWELGGVALPERRGGGSRPPGALASQERLTVISRHHLGLTGPDFGLVGPDLGLT
jgi:hypothetical protein